MNACQENFGFPEERSTPPGFSRWYFNFRATNGGLNRTGHHQALAGGTSISELQTGDVNHSGHHQALAGGTSISELQTGD